MYAYINYTLSTLADTNVTMHLDIEFHLYDHAIHTYIHICNTKIIIIVLYAVLYISLNLFTENNILLHLAGQRKLSLHTFSLH